ncbi:MAG: glycosyltransferase family 4 protein [Acidobacteriaceae bacterium]|nr:glycosyltransferase family 4 protein [Acidobacteriaceae bacterium]
MKLACVVHRYGSDIAGGSEAHCRQIAHRLAAHHDVTVLTTCARDHVTWRNEYAAGESMDGRVRVLRFPVARERSLMRFRDATDAALAREATDADEEQWFRENGPDTPALLAHLQQSGQSYELVLFWAFRYAEVFFGVPLVASRAILVPTAEDDRIVRMPLSARLFEQAAGFIFLTPEEQTLVARQLDEPLAPSCVVGAGLDAPPPPSTTDLTSLGIKPPFFLYLGRVDPNKGCEGLLRHFARFAAERSHVPQLVLAGPENMPIADAPWLKRLGFVDEAVRDALLTQATALVVPSRYESLSLVLLEGWNRRLPAIVNRACEVLDGQVRRADGGLSYADYDEFAHSLGYLLDHPDVARQLGQQGFDYVERWYRWPTVLETIEQFLQQVRHRADVM